MSLIINNPTHLKINNNVYALNTDFRNWISYSKLCLDESVDFFYRTERLIYLAFKESPKEDLQEIFKATLYFLGCGTELDTEETEKTEETAGKPKEIYFEYKTDFHRIKAGFYRQYNFNPWNLDYFHWWDFKACLDDLLGGTMENTLQARQIDLSEYKGKQRAKLQKIKDLHTIKTKESAIVKRENEQLNNLLIHGTPEQIIKALGGN